MLTVWQRSTYNTQLFASLKDHAQGFKTSSCWNKADSSLKIKLSIKLLIKMYLMNLICFSVKVVKIKLLKHDVFVYIYNIHTWMKCPALSRFILFFIIIVPSAIYLRFVSNHEFSWCARRCPWNFKNVKTHRVTMVS